MEFSRDEPEKAQCPFDSARRYYVTPQIICYYCKIRRDHPLLGYGFETYLYGYFIDVK
jgi:hypothetical protein